MTEKQFNKGFNTFILVGMVVVTVVVTAVKFRDAEGGRALLLLSAFGSMMGVLSTVFSANARILTFLFGFIDVSIYGAMCLVGARYGNAALHLTPDALLRNVRRVQQSNQVMESASLSTDIGGIYLDVFPVDGAPEGWLRQKWHFGRYEYYKRVLYLLFRDPYKHGRGPGSWVPLLCRRLYSLEEVQGKIRRILTKYDYDSCRLVADYDDGSKGVMPKTILGTPTPYDFEGFRALGVEQYDTYLSNKYGDYMTIPDGDHQRQHNFHYLDLEHAYKDYHAE